MSTLTVPYKKRRQLNFRGTFDNWLDRRRNHNASPMNWFYKELDLGYRVEDGEQAFVALRQGVLVAREGGLTEFTFGMGFASRLTTNALDYDFGGRTVEVTPQPVEDDRDWRRYVVKFAKPVERIAEIPFTIRFDLRTTPGKAPPDRIWLWESSYAVDQLALRVALPSDDESVRFMVRHGTPDGPQLHEEPLTCDAISHQFRRDVSLPVTELTYLLKW